MLMIMASEDIVPVEEVDVEENEVTLVEDEPVVSCHTNSLNNVRHNN